MTATVHFYSTQKQQNTIYVKGPKWLPARTPSMDPVDSLERSWANVIKPFYL